MNFPPDIFWSPSAAKMIVKPQFFRACGATDLSETFENNVHHEFPACNRYENAQDIQQPDTTKLPNPI